MKKKTKASEKVHIWTPEDILWTCHYCNKKGFTTKSELDSHEEICKSNPKNIKKYKYTIKEQEAIALALKNRLKKIVMYHERDNFFSVSPTGGLFWTEIPKKVVDEVIKETGIKIASTEPPEGEEEIENNRLVIKEVKKSKIKKGQKNNNNAIIGFILSLISIFGVGLAGIIGMILGIVALTKIKYTKEKGKGLAIAAIIIGFTWGFGISILRRLVEMGF